MPDHELDRAVGAAGGEGRWAPALHRRAEAVAQLGLADPDRLGQVNLARQAGGLGAQRARRARATEGGARARADSRRPPAAGGAPR